ncbi:hypothetical protein [Cupriavidus respiraculi]|uniref:hypothetical protein n=1 Tax=Cupriavidus respiraculi TaxID=195930 RepID=UPI001CC374F2|nr:hypothetical protein [Cupriavidus respiraculi]
MLFLKTAAMSTCLVTLLLNSTGASAASIDGWEASYVDMNCIADGVALDPQNNYVWNVKLIHPAQNQLTLVTGLYNKEVAGMFQGVELGKDVKVWLLIGGSEFQANEVMFDKEGWLVLSLDNSNKLQSSITRAPIVSLIMKPNQKTDKFRLSTLHLSNAKTAFDWLHKCTVSGIRSLPTR